ncbi:MAG TPA: hypothetical protein DGG95_15140 [Cytophagales bacterium]|jgi:hypothetical protein|nr:hypothetical protein [Cytophagales bacterium]
MSQGEGGGRPEIPIDEAEVEKLAMMQCSQEEIAAFFGVSVDTIYRRFADTLKRGSALGRMSMKRQLYKKVQDGELGAIVWWGKNFAGMSDKVEQKVQSRQEQIVYKCVFGSLQITDEETKSSQNESLESTQSPKLLDNE